MKITKLVIDDTEYMVNSFVFTLNTNRLMSGG